MASKEKPRRDSSERWLLTRKTWRYMADAGRRLIPEGWSPEAGTSGYQQLESEFQNVCKKEKSFLLWPRKKRADAAEEVDEEPVSSCLSDTPTTLGADSSLTGSDDEITVIEDQDYLAGPGAPMFDLVDGAYGASSEAYRSVGSRAFSSGSRVAPVGFDAADAEELKERLRHRQEQTREQEKEEEELMVTVGESLELEQDGVKKAMRHMGVQTDSRLQEPLLPLPPVETDSGKGTEAEVSTPETPLSPVSVVDSRADPYCSPTSVTSGVSVFGDLCKESTALKPPPKEPGKEAPKKEEQPSPMLDRFGDKLSRYMKMARRDSATRDKDKKDRFKTVNYDKTLRNIKSKRINADTLEDMSEDIKPLDLDDPPKSALPAAIRSGGKVTRAVGAAATPAASGTAVSAPQQPPDVKKRKRRGIQVGEPLPQYILDSLRGAFVSFRSMRKLSKAESELSASADDKCVDPLSPRYSITVSDDIGTRDLTLSDVESSTVPPFSLYSSARTSLDVTGECTGDDIFTGPRPMVAGGGGSHDTQAACTTVSTHASKASISSPCASPVPVIAGCVQRTSSSPQAAASSPGKPGFFARRKSSAKPPQAHPSPASTLQQQQLLQQQQPPGSKRGFFSTVMQKSAKTAGNHGSRVVAKKLWKSRSKSQSRTSLSSACVWTPQASCQWVNIQSRAVTLCDTSLLQLSEIEAAALQQVALEKLTDFNLGCTVRIPKDFNVTAGHKPKRRAYLLKKRPLTTGFFDTAKHDEKGDGGAGHGLVFGIPLQSCMENDRRLRQRGATPLRERLQGPAPAGSRSSHGGSHASFSSLIDAIRDKTTGSCESLNLMDKRSSVQDSSLSLASDAAGETSLQPHVPQIPLVLSTCIRHIETYGLQTVGVFRVSSSKKRARQLREDFDSGADVKLSEELCPHDVATLIKEFFRDLPEPLLPHDLYQPFLATQKIRNRRQQFECLQHLIQLLAVPNRDTLWALLCFLKKVADNAVDRRSNTGDWLTGNKMDSNNLATLFAPNMLHSLTNVGGAEMAQQTAERIDVINVVRSLIDHNNDLFQVSSELLHEAYQVLMERQPEALDILLRRRLQSSDDVDLELDTSSSVFEGSECSSQPAPTSERERSREGTEEKRRVRRRDASVQDPASSQAPPERSRRFRRRQDGGSGRDRSRRRDKSGSREDLSSGGGGGGGWFRRRVRSSSSTRPPSEEARSSEERPATRWFRRRDKSQSQSQASDSGSEAQQRRRGSLQAADRPLLMRTEVRQRSTSDQTVAGPAPPSGGQRATPRRLSSPELDVSGVITASLKIPVPAAARSGGPATGGVSPGEDIPYIEECQTVSGAGHDEVFLVRTGGGDGRHRHESSGSESQGAAEPITGSLSIQPLSRSRSGLVGEHGFVVATSSGGAVVARPQLRLLPVPLPAEAQISRSASASQVVSVPTEAAATVLPPPPAAAPRRSRPRPPEHVTHGQLLLPAGTAEVARSRTSPNISQQSTQLAAPAPTATPRRRHISHSSSSTEVAAEPRSRRREEPAPVRRSRRVAGRSVTANVYELQKAEAEPAVWKRRQLIASDSQTGV